MIVKNEEKVLARALKSVQAAVDEIIIVDTGSTDNTKKIAKQFTNKIFHFAWINDFSAARNFSFSKASGDYIMWLDADDEISKENLAKLIKLKQTIDGSIDAYYLQYAFARNTSASTLVYYRERIVKNNNTMHWQDPVHEFIKVNGKTKHVEIVIHHKKETPAPTDRNLNIYKEYIKNKNKLTPRQQFYYGRELYYNGEFNQAIKELQGFLSQGLGWIENNIEASIVLSKCYVATSDYTNALKTLFASFAYNYPRAEVLCEIGAILMLSNNYKSAITWLKIATKCKPNVKSGGFVLPQCYDIVPYLQLCVCYFNLNKIALAKKYNEKAEKVDANNNSVKINKAIFAQLENKKSKQ